jgi:flagellar basal body rod protein FlgC
MSGEIDNSVSGVQAALRRLDAVAHRIAAGSASAQRKKTPEADVTRDAAPNSPDPGPDTVKIDLLREMAALLEARTGATANLKSLDARLELVEDTLDLLG